MSIDLSAAHLSSSQDVHSDKAWIFLFDVNVGSSEIARFTNNTTSVSWNSETYQPYPMAAPEVPEQLETNTETFSLTIFNVDQVLTDRLRDDEIQGQEITITIIHEDDIGAATFARQVTATMLAAQAERQTGAVTLTIGATNWLRTILGRRFLRLRCRHVFGLVRSDGSLGPCGYDSARSGALTTCERTYADCVAHGTDEANAGLFNAHPLNFGGEPDLPRLNRG